MAGFSQKVAAFQKKPAGKCHTHNERKHTRQRPVTQALPATWKTEAERRSKTMKIITIGHKTVAVCNAKDK
jgi:hypothetical protein